MLFFHKFALPSLISFLLLSMLCFILERSLPPGAKPAEKSQLLITLSQGLLPALSRFVSSFAADSSYMLFCRRKAISLCLCSFQSMIALRPSALRWFLPWVSACYLSQISFCIYCLLSSAYWIKTNSSYVYSSLFDEFCIMGWVGI